MCLVAQPHLPQWKKAGMMVKHSTRFKLNQY